MPRTCSTGRIYLQNVDHCNTHALFNPKLANLCVQSNFMFRNSLPTKPLKHVNDENANCSLYFIGL